MSKKKTVGIYELLGLAVGCIGMSFEEFCACDFDEFEHITRAWHSMIDEQNRDDWERMRILATICIQPHTKKKLTPKQLIPLPWDRCRNRRNNNAPQLTKEQRRKRVEELMQRMNAAHQSSDEINR